jgi:hypothetical protein
MDSYIAPAPAGLWFERRTADGSFSRDPAPASSLYHLTSAITVAHRALATNRSGSEWDASRMRPDRLSDGCPHSLAE